MTHEPPYVPIDCAFHDRLEAQAVLGRRSRLRFDRGDGKVVEEEGRIVHISAKGGAEYLRLDSGTEVRLDRILSLENAGVEPPTGAPSVPDCPLCGAAGHPRGSERDGRRYLECPRCRLVFLDSAQRLGREEERARYEAHDNRPDDPGYRAFLARLADPLLARLPPGAEGLDFGSGPGPTLSALLEERGFPTAIYDPFFAPDPMALERSYDFITCTETIEHLFHPREELARLSSRLRPGGLLAIMTEVLRDEIDFSEWWYRRDPTHVAFYRDETFAWIGRTFEWSFERPHRNVVIFRTAGGGPHSRLSGRPGGGTPAREA